MDLNLSLVYAQGARGPASGWLRPNNVPHGRPERSKGNEFREPYPHLPPGTPVFKVAENAVLDELAQAAISTISTSAFCVLVPSKTLPHS